MRLGIKQEIQNDIVNLRNRIGCFRFVTLLIILFFIMDILLGPFRADVRILAQHGNLAILPFLQTSDFYMKVLFLGIVYFYSNIPFMNREEMLCLSRLGKERWGRRNISYIIGSSVILTCSIFIISIVEIFSVSKISLSWDSVYKTLSLTGGQNLQFEIPYLIIKQYEPFILMSLILFLDVMVISLIGMFMYAVSLYGYRVLACIMALLIALLPSIDSWMGGRLIYYSPVSWLDCSNWRIGHDNLKPDLQYIVVAGIFLNVLLVIICQKRVKKMEWKTFDD